jgi:hypothetical protein
MKHTLALLASLLPTLASAHPGHFDDMAVAHAMSHGMFYLLGFAALYLLSKNHASRIWRLLDARFRRR